MLGHNPIEALDPTTIMAKIESEIKKSNQISALFLEASAIEGYLSSLILLSRTSNTNPKKSTVEFVDKMQAISLISVNNILGNIDDITYNDLTKFNSKRNEFAHRMIGFNFEDPKANNEIEQLTSRGFELCMKISKIHQTKLEARFIR
jgi:hypothetical protein